MNIEIANRLQKLRKEKGFSQEELADALGISRQAVSKWERAEASPDTDNLICLAKLYNVSLDSLLDTDETIEELKEEQKEKAEEAEKVETKKEQNTEGQYLRDDEGNFVHIGHDGVHLKDADGSEVFINKHGVKGIDKDGHIMTKDRTFKFSGWFEGVLMLCALVAFLLLGFLKDMWATGWVVFLLPEIICSIIRCFEKKRLSQFNMPVCATFVFFFVCLVLGTGLWHIMWVVFLAIPIYYTIVGPIDYKLGDRSKWCPKGEENCNKEEDKD